MGKSHYHNYKREKRIQKEGADYAEPRKSCAADRISIKPNHRMAEKLQVSVHAARRFAERVLYVKTDNISNSKIWQIAKMMRSYLPTNLINESRMHMFDDVYAVINGDVIVTIVKKGK